MKKQKKFGRLIVTLLMCCVFVGSLPMQVQAAGKTLSVNQAKNMALSQSIEYQQLKDEMELARLQYIQAVKSIRVKEKNQRTFRWTPLLSFKFPEKPDLSDEHEYTYKALEMQSQIEMLKHGISDCVHGIYEEVSLSFVEVYSLQEQIAYNEKRISVYEATLRKNKGRLAMGLANPEDVESVEKSLEALEKSLVSDMRNFEKAKEDLGNLIGIDVSTSYTFQNPFISATLNRTIEEQLIEYTLENDDAYYQAKENTANGLLELDTNYDLMKNQYGGNMKMLDSFINQAKNGEKLNTAAFKLKYNEFLEEIDKRWQGKKKILFIRIPKEWFKGAIDGIRYVEDEPYALYESALEYQGLITEERAVKEELTASVKDYYENYVSTKNTCDELSSQLKKVEKDLKAASSLNAIGELSHEEYMLVKEEYESLQMDLLNAKAAHSEILYSFNRLTCGGLTDYLVGSSVGLSTASGGMSYVVEGKGEGVYYYIHSLVENNIFELGLSIPDDFEISITDFELWVDGVRVGNRTEATQNLRHLALDIKNVDNIFVRLYDGDTVIDDCSIDPTVYSDKLVIREYQVETIEDDLVGNFSVSTIGESGMVSLTIQPKPDQPIAYYNIKVAGGNYLISDKKISVNEKFNYLGLAEKSLDKMIICLYDDGGSLLYEAQFIRTDYSLRKIGE